MKKIGPIVFCFFLAACGFQLRGQATLPFETLYISFPVGNPTVQSPAGSSISVTVLLGTCCIR